MRAMRKEAEASSHHPAPTGTSPPRAGFFSSVWCVVMGEFCHFYKNFYNYFYKC